MFEKTVGAALRSRLFFAVLNQHFNESSSREGAATECAPTVTLYDFLLSP